MQCYHDQIGPMEDDNPQGFLGYKLRVGRISVATGHLYCLCSWCGWNIFLKCLQWRGWTVCMNYWWWTWHWHHCLCLLKYFMATSVSLFARSIQRKIGAVEPWTQHQSNLNGFMFLRRLSVKVRSSFKMQNASVAPWVLNTVEDRRPALQWLGFKKEFWFIAGKFQNKHFDYELLPELCHLQVIFLICHQNQDTHDNIFMSLEQLNHQLWITIKHEKPLWKGYISLRW